MHQQAVCQEHYGAAREAQQASRSWHHVTRCWYHMTGHRPSSGTVLSQAQTVSKVRQVAQ